MKSSLGFIFGYLMREKTLFLLGILTTLAASFCTWLSPQLLARVIDESFARKLILFFAISEFMKLALNYLTQKVFARFGQNVIERIRSSMIRHLMKVSVSYFDRSSSGQIMTRVVNDVNSLTDFFQSGLISIVGNLASVVAIFVGIWSINAKLAGVLFVLFVPFILACGYFSRKLKLAYENTRNELSHFNSMLADFLFGMKTIRALSLSPVKNKSLDRQIDRYSDAQVKMVHTFALFNPVLSLGIGVLFFGLILIGTPMLDEGVLKTGEWVAVLSYIFSLQQPLMEITDRWNFFLSGLTSIERIRNVFAEPTEKSGQENAPVPESIRLERVTFRYQPGSKAILKDCNLEIRRGDRIGIFGETGMGKTTLLQLLYGFYHPSDGDIFWNGRSYSHFSISKIREHFGVVEQFPQLFSGTIGENIFPLGVEETEIQVMREKFRSFPLISSLFNRFSEEVQERGGNLSMGERQMISFLRAHVKNPAIWILDEATAFFDQEAEREFMRVLLDVNDEHIILQIAHRREALSRMNRILKVDQGAVLELSTSKDSK